MKHVFRTTGKYWATEDGFGFVLCVVGTIGFYWTGIYWLAGAMGLIAIVTVKEIRRLWRARLEIDEQSLVVFAEDPLTIHWSEVRFARLLESFQKPRKVLQLGINDAGDEQIFDILLDHFDHKRIWEELKQHLPAAVFSEEARRQMQFYQKWEVEQKERTSHSSAMLAVKDAWWLKGCGWLMFLMFGFFAWFFFTDGGEGRILGTLLSLVFALLGGYVLLITGTVEVTQEAITRKVPLGWYSIRWDEIKSVSRDPYGSLVFCGDGKYLAIAGVAYWSSKNRYEAADFINTQIELRRLEVKNISANYSFAKNTKIK